MIIRFKILPKFTELFSGAALPSLTRFLFADYGLFTFLQAATILFLWFALLAYIGGPRLKRWIERFAPTLIDRLILKLPWRRKRLQRDFSSLLASLLDSGIQEQEAVRVAAAGTGNHFFIKRAGVVTNALREGVKLPDAISAVDGSGELRWRLGNAGRGAGFVRALAGWHEALDAKAFQLEQTAAQVTSTLIVLLNGLIVASIVIGIFVALIGLISPILW
jgi:type II secretory pathway component PulF